MENWMVYSKKADFKALADKFGIDPVMARIIRNRDIVLEEDYDMFLNGSISSLHNPRLLKDMDKAISIIKTKVTQGCKMRIIGDYDIDGICSIYILLTGLKRIGANVDYEIPHRVEDGYGINTRLVDKAFEDGVDTIITCDNGIAAIEQINYAKKLGMAVIVTDHHDIPYKEENGKKEYLSSNADAIVNPKQEKCKYPFKEMCGAVVVFKLVEILYEEYGISKEEFTTLYQWAAVATIGDVMPLLNENRIIVKKGLALLNNTDNTGFKYLILANELENKTLQAYHIGFILGPCLNASGRLDTAKYALELLYENDDAKAFALALKLKELNEERKQLTKQGVDLAIESINKQHKDGDRVYVIYLPDCHESIAGIIAGRIKEMYYRPTIVLTNREMTKCSARSIEGYNIYEEINKCAHLLEKFGGHPMAAGMSLKEENIEEFRRLLNANCTLSEKELTKTIWIDVPMPYEYASQKLIEQLKSLEPFGNGNPKPVFADKNLKLKEKKVLGSSRNVLKLSFETENGYYANAVYFCEADVVNETLEIGKKYAVLYYPDLNTFNDKVSIQMVVQSIKLC